MPGQGRLGDKANVPLDVHGCPACPHPAIGPAIQGSPDVNVNRRPALRMGDPGIHAACCGANTWTALQGSLTVFINGKPAHRIGDETRHCGGRGQLVEGSPNVIVGGGSEADAPLRERSWLGIELVDQHGKPFSGMAYVVIGADGRQYSGTLDTKGKAHIDGIMQGRCKVSFPDLDDDDW